MKKGLFAAVAVALTAVLCAPAFAQQSETMSSKSADAAKAGELPLDKVCLQRSDIYSAGAVVTMNEKPYVCKMDKNAGTGALSWVPMEAEG
ncbi:hypothetical protein [Salinisphaera sp. T5B8]|uniref:hypothetical protein n=1 Tax=Salinisphaera sp. T5B8 TaxID=1304154 RepID=UPI00333EFB86